MNYPASLHTSSYGLGPASPEPASPSNRGLQSGIVHSGSLGPTSGGITCDGCELQSRHAQQSPQRIQWRQEASRIPPLPESTSSKVASVAGQSRTSAPHPSWCSRHQGKSSQPYLAQLGPASSRTCASISGIDPSGRGVELGVPQAASSKNKQARFMADQGMHPRPRREAPNAGAR